MRGKAALFDPPTTQLVVSSDGLESLSRPNIGIEVVRGPDKGQSWVMEQQMITIGSHPRCDIVLNDGAVSRHHAELHLGPNGLVLKDLGSTNGTAVNHLRVVEAILPATVQVRLGASVLRIGTLNDTHLEALSLEHSFGELLGASPLMRALFSKMARTAPSEATVLLEGESGTGKELAARALHEHSQRRDGPFVVVDCSALPATLIESELFGHDRGAFTGAVQARQGALEQADQGTIFLDEIGELELALQPRLLRAIESREVKRLGSGRRRQVNIRVIAATNRSLTQCVADGTFREDLYYRLAVVRLTMPPLRERREDIPLLVRHLIQRLTPAGVDVEISDETLQQLTRRRWPGNVRELRNAVESALVLGEDAEPLPKAASEHDDAGVHQPLGHEPSSASERQLQVAWSALDGLPYKVAKQRLVEHFELRYLQELLAQNAGNLTHAARNAGIDRGYLLRLLDKYDMRPT